MKKPPNTQRLDDPGYPLITRERSDKLDLLQHLTANLARAVIVLGPEGVGKTRLLHLFKDALSESSISCTFNGDSLITPELIQEQISQTIAQKIPGYTPQSLPETLEKLPQQYADVALLIDDAGKLAPGIMEQIISFAEENPVLRVVFALTHNELYLKNTTDAAIDDCYQIEIPPLTELQCADFLEYLSTLPNPRIDFNAINETMVADLYRETHGIPGRILDKLPKPRNTKKLDYSAAILTCAVTGLIAIALGVQWWSSRPKPAIKTVAENKITPPTVTTGQQPDAANSQPPQQTTVPPNPGETKIEKTNATLSSQNYAAANQSAKAETPAGQTDPKSQINQTNSTVQADAKLAQPLVPATSAQATADVANTAPTTTQAPQTLDEGGQWVIRQPAENLTLQLMALADKQTIFEVMQRHQALGQNLRYLKTTTKRGKDRYVLLYGSFASPADASAEAKKLPGEFRNTWVRKMTSLQAELNSAPTFPSTAPVKFR